jgi:phosphoglycerate dehydrogenase-like enzyme
MAVRAQQAREWKSPKRGALFELAGKTMVLFGVGAIGERELRAMKPSAYLVNIGRGGTIQEAALIRALREGWIAGAGLDVFEQEPLPDSSPLWEMDNVIITAHYAGMTPEYDERAMAIFLDNLRRYRSGEPLRNLVDKAAGY